MEPDELVALVVRYATVPAYVRLAVGMVSAIVPLVVVMASTVVSFAVGTV
jgi:hypothetical protein